MSLYNSDYGSERVASLIFKENASVHLIGAGGAGMSPLGTLLASLGKRVTGFDRDMKKGLPGGVKGAHLSELQDVGLVVYSLAISERDPEIIEAKRRGIPLVSRAELLGAVMLGYGRRIGVCGSHGKSTTTAILDSILSCAGLWPTTVSGASLLHGNGYRLGGKDYFVYEACEYKDSFLRTSATDVIINNAELDHTDYFQSEEEIKKSFFAFASSATRNIVIGDDGGIASEIAGELGDRAHLVGCEKYCDFIYSNVEFCDTGTAFSLKYREKDLGRFKTGLIGEYNVKNTSSALAMAYLLGVDLSLAKEGLSSFVGIERRAEHLGVIGNRHVYYDYAHHPTEIRSFLTALIEKYERVTCIWRPHTYTRTQSLWDEFVSALKLAEYSVILDIYPAREEPIEGVCSERLAECIGGTAVALSSEDAVKFCIDSTDGAIALLGAGDVDDVKKELETLINNKNQ